MTFSACLILLKNLPCVFPQNGVQNAGNRHIQLAIAFISLILQFDANAYRYSKTNWYLLVKSATVMTNTSSKRLFTFATQKVKLKKISNSQENARAY